MINCAFKLDPQWPRHLALLFVLWQNIKNIDATFRQELDALSSVRHKYKGVRQTNFFPSARLPPPVPKRCHSRTVESWKTRGGDNRDIRYRTSL